MAEKGVLEMSKLLETFEIQDWNTDPSVAVQNKAVNALESGKVLYFPHLAFPFSQKEQLFYSPDKVDPQAKNISYNIKNDKLGGSLYEGQEAEMLKEMIKRYALAAKKFLAKLIPHYNETIIQAKTSFRPVEIFGRKSSFRKNDTLLHVDAFPSSPNGGERILRFFTNVNPEGKPRVWRLGEPFENVAEKMLPRISSPLYGVSHALKFLGITKGFRTPYDHYMLKMHDGMKSDSEYQKKVSQEEIRFPPGSSWIVFTDQVSHAAMSGQHVLEQTFNLPVRGLKNPATAPLKVLETKLQKTLV